MLASIPFSKMPCKILGFESVIPNTLRKTLKVFITKNTFWEGMGGGFVILCQYIFHKTSLVRGFFLSNLSCQKLEKKSKEKEKLVKLTI